MCAACALQVIALSQSVTKGATRRLQKPFAYVSSRYGTGLSLATHHSPLNLQPQPQPQPKPQPQLHPNPNQVRLYHDNVLSRAPGSAPTRWHCDDGPAGYMAVGGPQVGGG